MASLLISPIYLAKFSNGETLGLAAFVAAIVGGFNQVRGAHRRRSRGRRDRQPGGRLHLDRLPAGRAAVLLVLIILFRPQGLLGRKEERAV